MVSYPDYDRYHPRTNTVTGSQPMSCHVSQTIGGPFDDAIVTIKWSNLEFRIIDPVKALLFYQAFYQEYH
jgi:hypothetical protein